MEKKKSLFIFSFNELFYKFVNRVSAFVLFFCFSYAIFFGIIFVLNKIVLRDFPVKPKVRNLFVGDSHIQYGIRSVNIDNSLNLATSSDPYIFIYLKLGILLDRNPQIKTVFLGYSYHNISKYMEPKFDSPEGRDIIVRSFMILDSRVMWDLIVSDPWEVILSTKAILSRGVFNIFNPQEPSYIGKESTSYTSERVDNEVVQKRTRYQFYDGGDFQNISSQQILYLRRIISLCRERKVNIVLINTPLSKLYVQQVPEKFKACFHKLPGEEKVPVLNVENYFSTDSLFRSDGDHLKVEGATLLSKDINKMILAGKNNL
jgi:hypothetical protein